MAKSTLSRHGKNRVAALLSLSGFVVAACSAMSEEPAPVYVVRITSTAAPEAVAAAPIEREVMAPVALAPSMQAATAVGHPSSDTIPLDDPSSQPAPAPVRQAGEPVPIAAMPPPAPAPITPPPTAAPAPMPVLAPAPTPALATSTPAPAAAPVLAPTPTLAASPAVAAPVAGSAGAETSTAEPAHAAAAASPVREPVTAEPARADIATPGLFVKVKDDRARYRPRYYYSP